MPAEISVIVPVLNAEADLPRCLEALMEGLPAGLIREVIVSDGGSTDHSRAIADAAGAVIVTGPASRGGQLRRAAARARGRWLLVIHADTMLEPGWAVAVADHVARADTPACFRLAFRAHGPGPALVAGWANLRTALFALPYGDQGLLVRAVDYAAAGGYPDQPLMEDVALVRALGRPIAILPVRAMTGAERYLRDGWIKRGARNLWTLARYLAGADPARLADRYRK